MLQFWGLELADAREFGRGAGHDGVAPPRESAQYSEAAAMVAAATPRIP
jgi:hypothetical protein